MKLIIQIPCLNEEAFLPRALADLPQRVAGFDRVERLVVDDGSSDRTADVAATHGADHVVRLPVWAGLATAFRAGLHAALERGADVIVNTDADAQYRGADVPRLVAPILAGEADLVVGCRDHAHAGAARRLLQRAGSWSVGRLTGESVPDAASGFRAFSRAAAARLELTSEYTHTLETLIRAPALGLRTAHVPVRTNPPVRPSRLAPGAGTYLARNARSLVRLYVGDSAS